MIRKYVAFIDVDVSTGEVFIEGLEDAPLIDKLNIGNELIYQYEDDLKEYKRNV